MTRTCLDYSPRDEMTHLRGQRVRIKGSLVNIFKAPRNKKTYQLVLKDVVIDQSPQVIDHLNIFVSLHQMQKDQKEKFKMSLRGEVTFTAEVIRYKRKYNDDNIRTVDYGVRNIKKLIIEERS